MRVLKTSDRWLHVDRYRKTGTGLIVNPNVEYK